MRKIRERFISAMLTVAVAVSFAMPASAMSVSAPKYTRVASASEYYQVEAPENGQFKDVVTWGTDNNYGAQTGNFRTDVDITGGSGYNASLFAAIYDSSWNLIQFLCDKKAQATDSTTLSVSADIASGQLFKAFLWDSEATANLLTVQPEAPEILYFYCDDPNTVTIAWYNLGGSYSVWKNGTQVANSGFSSVSGYDYIGKHSGLVYTDTAAADGDTYVVKNGTTASETLTADFTDTAYVVMGKYVKGRNMAYLRNDNAAWYSSSVSEHRNILGTECDRAVYRTFNANNRTYEKWTNYYLKFDQDYINGSGNALDVTIDYYDYGTNSISIYYYPDSNTSNTTNVSAVTMTNTKTWKSVTKRISAASFLADTGIDGEYQMFLMLSTGGAVSRVSVTPYYDITVSTPTAANRYTDGIEVRWSVSGTTTSGITGYTIKRNGTTIATNHKGTVYYDRGLASDTTYTYTVTPEFNGKLISASESAALSARTQKQQLTMTLPFLDNYTSNISATSSNETANGSPGSGSGVFYTENGLTFRLQNYPSRWRNTQTVARLRGGKYCRATVCNDYGSNADNRYNDYLAWYGDKRATYMMFRVDNDIIPTTQRDIIIEFDYYDDPQFDGSDGNLANMVIDFKYLKYNSGNTPTTYTKGVASFTGSGEWKTAKITLNDAQFSHNGEIGNDDAKYDFQIGVGSNRGGFAMTNIKVYAPESVPMPIFAEVNEYGTGYVGTLPESIGNSYPTNIGFSGTDGLGQVGGSYYAYNREHPDGTSAGWRRWRNSFYFDVPNDYLYGIDYTKVEIEVEYYAPTSNRVVLLAFNTNKSGGIGEDEMEIATATTGAWTTKTYTLSFNDAKQARFFNEYGTVDFRISFYDAQAYLRKVTVRKII